MFFVFDLIVNFNTKKRMDRIDQAPKKSNEDGIPLYKNYNS